MKPTHRESAPSSISYYEDNAQAFIDDTLDVDLSPLYTRFLAHVAVSGQILDAGCGSGRDARWFLSQGYRVEAFDASPTLAGLAEAYCGVPVAVLRFQDIDWHAHFDGIWACASLLHVPMAELPEVMQRLSAALKPGGVLYASFKYGRGEREHNGRRFTDLDEAGLTALLRSMPALAELETWTTTDQRPARADERWLNTLLEANTRTA